MKLKMLVVTIMLGLVFAASFGLSHITVRAEGQRPEFDATPDERAEIEANLQEMQVYQSRIDGIMYLARRRLKIAQGLRVGYDRARGKIIILPDESQQIQAQQLQAPAPVKSAS